MIALADTIKCPKCKSVHDFYSKKIKNGLIEKLVCNQCGFIIREYKALLGRNSPCYCGSKKKYKKCHLNNQNKL